MICPKCGNKLATIRYAEVVDGKVTERYLCPDCIAKYQKEAGAGFALADDTPTTADRPSAERLVNEAVRAQRACPSCGTPLTTVVDDGMVGCRTCFDHFGKEIDSILEGLHRGMQHKGKVSKLDNTRARTRADLQNKRQLLRTMLKAENYEEAARLRDEIRALEGGLSMADSGTD